MPTLQELLQYDVLPTLRPTVSAGTVATVDRPTTRQFASPSVGAVGQSGSGGPSATGESSFSGGFSDAGKGVSLGQVAGIMGGMVGLPGSAISQAFSSGLGQADIAQGSVTGISSQGITDPNPSIVSFGVPTGSTASVAATQNGIGLDAPAFSDLSDEIDAEIDAGMGPAPGSPGAAGTGDTSAGQGTGPDGGVGY